jgi:hypothetical protein
MLAERTPWIRPAGMTYPPGKGHPEAEPDEYTVLVNTANPRARALLLPILLHELTHVVDPCFLEDLSFIATLETDDSAGRYDLRSEQRAFTAMWISDLRDAIAAGTFRGVGAWLIILQGLSPEFEGFVGHAQLGRPHLYQQIRDHIDKMAVHLREQAAGGEESRL